VVLASAALATMPRSKLAVIAMLLLGALALGGTALLLAKGGASEPRSVPALSGSQSKGQLQSLSNLVTDLFQDEARTVQVQFSPALYNTDLHIVTMTRFLPGDTSSVRLTTESARLTLGHRTDETQQLTLTADGVMYTSVGPADSRGLGENAKIVGAQVPIQITLVVTLTATPQPGSSGPANWYCNSATALFTAVDARTGKQIVATGVLKGFTWARIAGSGG
jgi:hypothetical protein